MTFQHPSAPRLHIGDIRSAADGSIEVELAGELDTRETERLRAGITGVVREHGPAPIRIDASRLTFLDSAGIRGLLACRRIIGEAGSRLSISVAHPNVFQVLQITGLLSVFDVVEQSDVSRGQAARHIVS
ncbi:STAS domain-containing protein [Actinoplanes xinjiangensis]|uniref:STAS domain-containing protein n=1 Tax=Actinoplanes xinjiangensis TaxID=512350 RepID=UPI003438536E